MPIQKLKNMNTIINNRRSFLKISAATGGGMLLGFNIVGCKSEPKLPDFIAPNLGEPAQWSNIGGFIKIGENGVVTIMSPNPEIGQNVKTSMPMIIAEELDADWDKVIVEQAGLDTEKYTRQVAGGSQSIRQGWEGLRKAGATARQMLLDAAAAKWNVPASELTTSKGIISHSGSGQTMSYGDISNAASALEVPEEVTLKDPKDFVIIGKDTRNVDGFKIAQGKPLFGIDVQKPGMKIAMIEHPPAFGMKLKSMDASVAKGMSGIQDVFTINTKPEGAAQQWSDVNAYPELVVVVGESTWQVMKAKKALKLEWEVDTALESSSDHEGLLTALMATSPEEAGRKDGNPEKAFAEAAQVIEKTYNAPFLAHNTMEPMNFFAHVTADKAEVEGPIQTPQYLRMTLSAVLGMPEENVSIMMTRMGGGFGRRLYGHFGTEAAVISQKINAPVKLVYSREDDMTQGTYRPAYKVTYRAGLDAEGNLVAFHVKGSGTKDSPVFANRYPAGAVDNYLAESLKQDSNISIGAWRAPRSNFIATAEQSFLDEVAEAAGKDPIDFRLELFDKALASPVGEKNDYDAERYAAVLKLVKEKSNWGTETPGVFRGVSAYYCHNSYVAQVLDVVMDGDNMPQVKKVFCAVDCGIVVNPEGAKNQIEGGIVDGIGHALYSAMTFKDGKPEQNNFHQYRLIRNTEAPKEIEVHFVDNGIDPTGLGEPSLPPIGAALANAIYQATKKRLYTQPYMMQEALLG
ncbi:MAG: isoquinoline 1-oxidoreductase beta subunit [Saprospiraceae bacterium]|jgi:isoquinoline 1-oxidoreductase beta subunit